MTSVGSIASDATREGSSHAARAHVVTPLIRSTEKAAHSANQPMPRARPPVRSRAAPVRAASTAIASVTTIGSARPSAVGHGESTSSR